MVDPRTAARVTTPSLLKAFAEGMGHEEKDSDKQVAKSSPLKLWVIQMVGDEVVAVTELPFYTFYTPDLPKLLDHLQQGADTAVLFFCGIDKPEIVIDAEKALSNDLG